MLAKNCCPRKNESNNFSPRRIQHIFNKDPVTFVGSFTITYVQVGTSVFNEKFKNSDTKQTQA